MRPALVIQNDIGNEKAPTTIVAAISGSSRPYPMNVVIDPPEGGLDHSSTVKTSQILTISRQRLERPLGHLSASRMEKVDRAIKISLGLS